MNRGGNHEEENMMIVLSNSAVRSEAWETESAPPKIFVKRARRSAELPLISPPHISPHHGPYHRCFCGTTTSKSQLDSSNTLRSQSCSYVGRFWTFWDAMLIRIACPFLQHSSNANYSPLDLPISPTSNVQFTSSPLKNTINMRKKRASDWRI